MGFARNYAKPIMESLFLVVRLQVTCCTALITHEYFSNWDLRPVCQLSATSRGWIILGHLFDVNLSQTVFKPVTAHSSI